MVTHFHPTRQFPTWESYAIRKTWKRARHLSKLSDAEILSRVGQEDGVPCGNCLFHGFRKNDPEYSDGNGRCYYHFK